MEVLSGRSNAHMHCLRLPPNSCVCHYMFQGNLYFGVGFHLQQADYWCDSDTCHQEGIMTCLVYIQQGVVLQHNDM